MRAFIVGILAVSSGVGFAEDASCFGKFFQGFPTFKNPSARIAWTAPTNSGAGLWVYKSMPQKFSDTVISNLMVIGRFTAEDKKEDRTLTEPSTERISFTDDHKPHPTRSLTILPEYGFIDYWDQGPKATKSIEGVPKTEEVQTLALKIFKRLGFSESDLARKPGSTNFLAFEDTREHTHFDKVIGESVTETSLRGIHFVRQIDGVPIAGIGSGGGFFVRFGNHGGISDLQVSWRNLKQLQRCQIASPDLLSRWIREGKAVMTHRDISGPDQADALSLRQEAKKLTITQMVLLYTSERGAEQQDYVCPFAKLEVVAESRGTNCPMQLYCPVVTDQK
jgi:hypothetical protein